MICECGCGQEVAKPGNRFICGHYWKGKHRSETTKIKLSCIGRGKTSNFKGYKHTASSKQKISNSNKGRKHTDKTKNKISEAHSGEKSYLWRGGISFDPYCPKFNETFKEKIRDRFDRVCLICGKTEKTNGKKLSVHHVDYNKECGCDGTICECIPLCMSCHGKVHSSINKECYENVIIEKLATFINH